MRTIHAGMTQGQRIRAARENARLTQVEAAGLYGKSVSLWRKLESDERRVSALSDWLELARVLGVSDLRILLGRPLGSMARTPAEHDTVAPIRAALTAYRPTGDAYTPEVLAERVDALVTVWQTRSPWRFARVGAALPDEMRAAAASAAAVEGTARRDVLRTTSRLLALVRAYLKKVGAQEWSVLAADRSLQAAEQADDLGMTAAAAWNMVQILSVQGHTENAYVLSTDAAGDVEGRLRAQPSMNLLGVYGALHLAAAIQAARLDRSDRADAHLAEADRAAQRTGETNAYDTAFGPTNVGIHRAAVEWELSHYGEAVRIAQSVDVGPVATVERRFAHHLQLAHSLAQRKEDIGAVAMLGRAFAELPEELGLTPHARTLITDLVDRETPATSAELRPIARAVRVIE